MSREYSDDEEEITQQNEQETAQVVRSNPVNSRKRNHEETRRGFVPPLAQDPGAKRRMNLRSRRHDNPEVQGICKPGGDHALNQTRKEKGKTQLMKSIVGSLIRLEIINLDEISFKILGKKDSVPRLIAEMLYRIWFHEINKTSSKYTGELDCNSLEYTLDGKGVFGPKMLKYLLNQITSPTHDPASLAQYLNDIYRSVTEDPSVSLLMKGSKIFLRMLSFHGYILLTAANAGQLPADITVNSFVVTVNIGMRLVHEAERGVGFSMIWLNKVMEEFRLRRLPPSDYDNDIRPIGYKQMSKMDNYEVLFARLGKRPVFLKVLYLSAW